MMAAKYNPDPSDLSTKTIKNLFYQQIRSLSMNTARSVDERMNTFDMQFGDCWF